MDQVASLVKSGRDDVASKIKLLVDKNRQLEKELEQLKSKLASSQGDDLANQAVTVNGIQVLAARLDGADPKGLRDTVDQLKNKLQKAVVILAAVNGDKISLVAGVTKNETTQVKAGDLLKSVAEQIGGKGGGRPDMAQGGGNQPENLDMALKSVETWVETQLS
jgi:alanyl-tRNA synthetase